MIANLLKQSERPFRDSLLMKENGRLAIRRRLAHGNMIRPEWRTGKQNLSDRNMVWNTTEKNKLQIFKYDVSICVFWRYSLYKKNVSCGPNRTSYAAHKRRCISRASKYRKIYLSGILRLTIIRCYVLYTYLCQVDQ